jgi:chromosome segregation ATPase
MATVKTPTMRDSKQTILDAYKTVLAEKKAAASQTVNPAKEAQVKKAKATINRANGIPDVSNIQSFQSSFMESMTGFTTNFGNLLSEFNDVKESIDLKKAELNELFAIETEAFTLASLIDSQRVSKEAYLENIQQTKIESEQRLNDSKNQLKMEIVELKGEIEKTRKTLTEDQERNREVFDYNFKREQRDARDKLEDELNTKRKDYTTWADEQNDNLSDLRTELLKKQSELEAQEQEVADIKVQIANMPTVIKEKVKSEVGKQKAILESRLESEKKLIEMENSGIVNLLNSEKVSLESSNEVLKSQVSDLTSKLEKAYGQLRDLASDTVKGASTASVVNEVRKQVSAGK